MAVVIPLLWFLAGALCTGFGISIWAHWTYRWCWICQINKRLGRRATLAG